MQERQRYCSWREYVEKKSKSSYLLFETLHSSFSQEFENSLANDFENEDQLEGLFQKTFLNQLEIKLSMIWRFCILPGFVSKLLRFQGYAVEISKIFCSRVFQGMNYAHKLKQKLWTNYLMRMVLWSLKAVMLWQSTETHLYFLLYVSSHQQ